MNLFPELKAPLFPGASPLPSQHLLVKQRKNHSDITFVGVPQIKEDRSSLWSQLKNQLPAHMKDNPAGAADFMYNQMHKMSMRASSKVKRRRHDTIISDKSYSTHSSVISISTVADKIKPLLKHYVIHNDAEGEQLDPRFLLEDDVRGGSIVKNTKEHAQWLIDRSHDSENARKIVAIIRYKGKIIYMMKMINLPHTPASALKVQWRISRYLLAPSFFLVFSMLNRYGQVVALVKRTPNSALCVFDTVDVAARALNMHSLQQSNKVLILSWWHPKPTSLTNEATTDTLDTSRWLQTICDGILKKEEHHPKPSLQEERRASTYSSVDRRSSSQTQRHMSIIKMEIKRALVRYSNQMKESHEFVHSMVGNLPLIRESKMSTSAESSGVTCCKSRTRRSTDFTGMAQMKESDGET